MGIEGTAKVWALREPVANREAAIATLHIQGQISQQLLVQQICTAPRERDQAWQTYQVEFQAGLEHII